VISWFLNICFHKFNLYRYTTGLCAAHGGGKLCQEPDCEKWDAGFGFCRSHGGGKRCNVEGCNTPVKLRGRPGYPPSNHHVILQSKSRFQVMTASTVHVTNL
jgi:hypothetical protein